MIKNIIFCVVSLLFAIAILFTFVWATSLRDELTVAQAELIAVNGNLLLERRKMSELGIELDRATKELGAANATISDLKAIEYELVYMGDFKITYYCDERRNHICGGNGVTASGKETEVGVTAAADWNVLPNGSVVYIDGVGFREITDVGGAVNGNHIDVLVQGHNEALDRGVEHQDVWLLIKKGS